MRISKRVRPGPEFMFDSDMRDRLLFEDESYSMVRIMTDGTVHQHRDIAGPLSLAALLPILDVLAPCLYLFFVQYMPLTLMHLLIFVAL